MNEIEKMYENADIKPKQKGYCDCGTFCPYPNHKCNDECPYWKYENEAKYPPFTPEKQLLLLQWLAKTRPIHITNLLDKWTIEGMVRYGIKYDTFTDALSGYINNLWQDLTDAEKAQIKEILSE